MSTKNEAIKVTLPPLSGGLDEAAWHLSYYFGDLDEDDLIDEGVDPAQARTIGEQLAAYASGRSSTIAGGLDILEAVWLTASHEADPEAGPYALAEVEGVERRRRRVVGEALRSIGRAVLAGIMPALRARNKAV